MPFEAHISVNWTIPLIALFSHTSVRTATLLSSVGAIVGTVIRKDENTHGTKKLPFRVKQCPCKSRVKVKMKRQKTIQQFFHSKASKTNQGEEHIKNQEYINMSSEDSSGISTSDQPEAQIQLPTKETVSPKPKGSSRCLSVKVFPFIEVTKDGYWCTSCKKACEEGKLPNAIIGKSGGAWFVKPISKADVDKLCEKAAKHQASGVYQHAESLISPLSKPILEVLNEAVKNAGDTTQFMRTNMAVASYFLFKQEIPLTTNWRPMLSALSLVHPEVEHWFRTRPANAHYLSARNSTDWLEACGATVKDSTVEKVKNSLTAFKKFAYMADECTDANGHQVLSHCVRYLDIKGRPVDAFLDVQVIEDTSTASVTTHILEELNACQFPKQMAACAFDGAANFSGRHGGVQAFLREKCNPNLSYTHSRGHLLQLALVRAAESSKTLKKLYI
ncbi:uncharacterized protein LOC135977525 [Chrysemys picta bellii]|uniref:uncharacterized protein LOC135977525 n=1 Tax=Chrysemys picta bellii TaxID=8478 RepID=UPI0032B27F88